MMQYGCSLIYIILTGMDLRPVAGPSSVPMHPMEDQLGVSADLSTSFDEEDGYWSTPSPGPSAERPLYSDIGNNPDIERSLKLLLADPDCSLFDMSIVQLFSVLSTHGINTSNVKSTDEAILQILDHIMNGKCFLKSCNGSACAVVRRGMQNAGAMAVLAAETVLLEVDVPDRVRSVCFALGYTAFDLSKISSVGAMKCLVEMSRDNFSTCFNIPDIMCNLDKLSVSDMKVLSRIHSVDITDLESLPVTRWTDAAMSRLIQHFSTAECEMERGSVRRGHVPKCKESTTNRAFLQVAMLEAVLARGGALES